MSDEFGNLFISQLKELLSGKDLSQDVRNVERDERYRKELALLASEYEAKKRGVVSRLEFKEAERQKKFPPRNEVERDLHERRVQSEINRALEPIIAETRKKKIEIDVGFEKEAQEAGLFAGTNPLTLENIPTGLQLAAIGPLLQLLWSTDYNIKYVS